MKFLTFNWQRLTKSMQTNTRRGKPSSRMPGVLALLLIIGNFGLLAALMVYEIPDKNEKVIFIMAGNMITLLGLACGYYYSTTHGSKNKDELIAAAVPVQRQEE